MKTMNKKFDKYYVAKDPDTGKALEENGLPVLGELKKAGCTLEQKHADILNFTWREGGYYFKEVTPDNKEADKEARKEERRLLFEKADKLFEDGKIEKVPPKNISTIKLKELIKE